MKRMPVIVVTIVVLLGIAFFGGASAGEQYERNHLEYLRQQNRLLERQNELLRDHIVQVKRIADLLERRQR